MIQSNQVVADLLQFSLGMLPAEYARKAKQRFNQSLLWDPLAADDTEPQSFTTDRDSWWVGLAGVATSRDTATFAIVADRPMTVEINASSGGRDFQSAAEDFDNVFGTAQLPAVWGAPFFVKPSSTIRITLFNLVATARLVRVSLMGFKIFNTDMGE